MFANKAKALVFAASLVIAAASAYMILQEGNTQGFKLKPLAVVSPSFIKDAKDLRADRYLPVVKSLSASYGAFFLGGWNPSDVIDDSLITVSKGGFYGLNCAGNGMENPYNRGTISASTACCVNTLNRTLNESMPNGLLSEEPEVYKISKSAYDALSTSNYQRIVNQVTTDLYASISALGGTIDGLSARVSDSAVSANLVNNTLEIINENLAKTRSYGSCNPDCQCTDYVTNPDCVNVTVSACGATYHINLPCFLGADTVAPGPPTSLTANQTLSSVIKLTWVDPPDHDIQIFNIYIDGVKRDSVPFGNVTRTGSSPPFTTTYYLDESKAGFVISDGNHRFKVTAVDSNPNEGNPSNEVQIYVDKAPPATPALSGTKCGPSTSCLSWTASAGAAGYRLYRAVGPVSKSPGNLTADTGAITYNDVAVTAPFYNYTVTAYDAMGNEGTESNTVKIIFDTTPPVAPSSFTATLTNPSTGLVTLAWTSPGGDTQGFVLYRNGTQIATLGSTAASYSDDLSANGTYTYGISAFDRVPNYGTNATATVTADAITLAPAVRETQEDLKLEHSFTIYITANVNKTIRRVTLYKRVATMFFDVDVDVNYTIGGTPYRESFRKRLTITPSEIPVSSGAAVAARATSPSACRYTYEVREQANIAVVKDRAVPTDVVNDWFDVDVRYTEADTASACIIPLGVNTGIVYGNCLVS